MRYVIRLALALGLASVSLLGCDSAYAACAGIAADYGPTSTVSGAFNTTVGRVRAFTPGSTPSRWPGLPAETPAVLCYLDGPVGRAPPGGDRHDRAVLAVSAGHVEFIMSGY